MHLMRIFLPKIFYLQYLLTGHPLQQKGLDMMIGCQQIVSSFNDMWYLPYVMYRMLSCGIYQITIW